MLSKCSRVARYAVRLDLPVQGGQLFEVRASLHKGVLEEAVAFSKTLSMGEWEDGQMVVCRDQMQGIR